MKNCKRRKEYAFLFTIKKFIELLLPTSHVRIKNLHNRNTKRPFRYPNETLDLSNTYLVLNVRKRLHGITDFHVCEK